jgi:hypothetical protein
MGRSYIQERRSIGERSQGDVSPPKDVDETRIDYFKPDGPWPGLPGATDTQSFYKLYNSSTIINKDIVHSKLKKKHDITQAQV